MDSSSEKRRPRYWQQLLRPPSAAAVAPEMADGERRVGVIENQQIQPQSVAGAAVPAPMSMLTGLLHLREKGGLALLKLHL